MLKKSLLLSCLAIASSPIYANLNANNGAYIGLNVSSFSHSVVPGASLDATFQAIPEHNLLTVSPVIGYRFNDYLALESTYNSLINSHNAAHGIWGADHYRLYTVDLSGKLIAPFENGMSLFGLGGLAFTHQSVFNATYAGSTASADTNSNRLLPLLGVGASYNFTKNISTQLSFKHMFSQGKIGDINLLGLGVTYTFGSDQ